MPSNTKSEDAAQAIEAAFFDRLRELMPGEDLAPAIHAHLATLTGQVQHLIANELDAMNVRFTLLAVAGHDALAPRVGLAEAMRLVDACLNQPLRGWVLEGTRQMLDQAPDPYEALVSASKEREARYFGESFAFERPVDDGYGYVLHVKRCLFHETLRACDRAELQPLLCRFDLNWIDAIDPVRHRMRFARPSTFATAETCRMWFMRLEPPVDAARHLPVIDGPAHG